MDRQTLVVAAALVEVMQAYNKRALAAPASSS
jgi:hypothetical protein